MSVEIHDHPDGGGLIAVTVNGFIRWCGRGAATARLEAVVPENSAHLEVWLGRRCVLATEVDDELPFDRRVAIANRLAVLINQGRRP